MSNFTRAAIAAAALIGVVLVGGASHAEAAKRNANGLSGPTSVLISTSQGGNLI